MLADEDVEFFQAGVKHYPQALRAVTRFREMVVGELQDALQRIPKASILAIGEEAAPSTSTGSGAPYISAFASTRSKKRVEIGLWWSPPWSSSASDVTVSAYATVTGVPYAKKLTKPDAFPGGLYKGAQSTYLTMSFSAQSELPKVLNELLGYLERSVLAEEERGG